MDNRLESSRRSSVLVQPLNLLKSFFEPQILIKSKVDLQLIIEYQGESK